MESNKNIKGYLTDDRDLDMNNIEGYFGGNGDVYLSIEGRDLNGKFSGKYAVRISLSGGNFPMEVKTAAAKFVKAMIRHKAGLEGGVYHEYKDKNILVNGHEFVELGLPSGLKWATCNVGATSPEQAGLYFAWGETTGFTADDVTKGVRPFNSSVYNSGPSAAISADLTLEQDAAHVHMGGKWRMPTKAEFQELIDNCTVTWTSDYNGTGVAGSLFSSKVNGNSVFFPATGYCYGSSVNLVGSLGYYWSASWDSSSIAWSLYFSSGSVYVYNCRRYYGFSVRGVCE